MLQFRQMQDGTYALFRNGIAVILGLTLAQADEAIRLIGNSVPVRSATR